MFAVAFEVEHGVDKMLEDAGACDAAVFGDMSYQEYGNLLPFGQAQAFVGAFADLSDAAGHGGQRGTVHGLNRVDDDTGVVAFFDLAAHGFDVGFGQHHYVVV